MPTYDYHREYSADASARARRRRGARRRRQAGGGGALESAPRFVAAAAIAYGAYRLGSWAWNSYNSNDGGFVGSKNDDAGVEPDDDASHEESCEEDDDDDVERRGETKGLEGGQHHRSRRSRLDRGEPNRGAHSRHPSPPHDRRRRSAPPSPTKECGGGEEGTYEDGGGKRGGAVGLGLEAGSVGSVGVTSAGGAAQTIRVAPPSPAVSRLARAARVSRCRVETSRAFADFLPTLKKVVAKETDQSKETTELKSLRARRRNLAKRKKNTEEEEERGGDVQGEDEMEEETKIREKERVLWNSIKNKSVTRLVTTVYAHAVLFLVLTVQVNLLGGRLLREELREEEEEEEDDNERSVRPGAEQYRSCHRTVLARTYHRFFSEGIPALAEEVERAVEIALEDWDVSGGSAAKIEVARANTDDEGRETRSQRGHEGASIDDVSSRMEKVRDLVEEWAHHRRRPRRSCLARFIIPHDDNRDDGDDEDDLATHILDETYDLLESPAFSRAERACLDETFAELDREGYGNLFFDVSGGDAGAEEIAGGKRLLPLARVVTGLQKRAVATFHRPLSSSSTSRGRGSVGGLADGLPEGFEEILGTMMMGESLSAAPSFPNAYVPRFEKMDSVLELGDVSFD